jgi:hypothetical protein
VFLSSGEKIMQDADIVVGHTYVVTGTHGWAGFHVFVLENCGPNACPSISPHGTISYKCALNDDPNKRWAFLMASELEVPASIPDDWSEG